MAHWTKLSIKNNVGGRELMLRNTLVNGQCFNWYTLQEHDYAGVLDNYLIRLKQNTSTFEIEYRYHTHLEDSKVDHKLEVERILRDYLQLDYITLIPLYKKWNKDAYFSNIGPYLPGVRILKQDPWECTMSFLVSQNNNIKRITGLMAKFRSTFGTLIGSLDSVWDSDEQFDHILFKEFYTFPSVKQLIDIDEGAYRDLGLGYRGKHYQK